MKSLLAVMWPLVLVAGINAQDNARSPQRAAIRTPEGAHFIWNQPNDNFTLDIRGKDVRPNNRTDDVYFEADDIIVQIQTSAISQFISGPKANRPDEHSILTLHRDWETQHAETILGKLTILDTTETKLSNGRVTLLWRFNLPKGFEQYGKMSIFLTTVNEDSVIVLAANTKSDLDEGRVRQFLIDTMGTLKVSDKPFELPTRQR